jgi:hypothetical protein
VARWPVVLVGEHPQPLGVDVLAMVVVLQVDGHLRDRLRAGARLREDRPHVREHQLGLPRGIGRDLARLRVRAEDRRGEHQPADLDSLRDGVLVLDPWDPQLPAPDAWHGFDFSRAGSSPAAGACRR